MPMKCDNSGARKRLGDMRNRAHRAILRSFRVAGETAVSVARAKGNYTDRTGNLRNSIGYVIVHRGVVVDAKGTEQATEMATKEARSIAAEYVIVVVAAMDYATHVVHYGYDVLDSAEVESTKVLRELLKSLRL